MRRSTGMAAWKNAIPYPGELTSPIPSGAKDLDIDLAQAGAGRRHYAMEAGAARPDQDRNGGTWSTSATLGTTADYEMALLEVLARGRPGSHRPRSNLTASTTMSIALAPRANATPITISASSGGGAAAVADRDSSRPENAVNAERRRDRAAHDLHDRRRSMRPSIDNYTACGVNWSSIAASVGTATTPTDGCTTTGNLNTQVNACTAALCQCDQEQEHHPVGDQGRRGQPRLRMTGCARAPQPGRYLQSATNSASTLQTTFKSIADQISQLRLTR